MHSTVKDNSGFIRMTNLLRDYGYGEEYVYRFYDIAFTYQEQEREHKEQTFTAFWGGSEETPEKVEAYNKMMQKRKERRRLNWQRMLRRASEIDDEELLNAALEIPLTEPFGLKGNPEPAEGEQLIQKIKDD